MGLTTTFRHGEISAVGLYCAECGYLGGSRTGYYQPSFIVEAFNVAPQGQRMILSEIRRHYLGAGNLTQGKMEGFFYNDVNFSACTPDFFSAMEVHP